MILLLSVYIRPTPMKCIYRSDKSGDRLEIFKYMLSSYKNIPFTDIYIYILLHPQYEKHKGELVTHIYDIFSHIDSSKITIVHDRFTTQLKWYPVISEITRKHGLDELVWFSQNDDHVFVDFNTDILKEGIDTLKCESSDFKSIYLSHWPEILKLSGKVSKPSLIKNYVRCNGVSLLDSIQIFNLKMLYYIFIEYKWKSDHIRIDSILNEITLHPAIDNPLKQIIYIPLREMVRHFDGYGHVNIQADDCPPLHLFPVADVTNYSKDALIRKMIPKFSSPWTANNKFVIPKKWIDINRSLHPIEVFNTIRFVYTPLRFTTINIRELNKKKREQIKKRKNKIKNIKKKYPTPANLKKCKNLKKIIIKKRKKIKQLNKLIK